MFLVYKHIFVYIALYTLQIVHFRPEMNGWVKVNDIYEEVPTTLCHRSQMHLIKCNCGISKCSNFQCSCRKEKLTCTDICGCSMNDEFDCENIEGINEDERDNSDDESSDIEF